MSDDAIVQRWRRPVVPLGIEEESTYYTIVNGRETQEISGRFTKDDIERFRLGYCCINCWEPHEQPMPEKCSVCQFPIRDKQREVFTATFAGVKRDRRAVLIEQELDRVDDTHERRFYETKSGIVIPRPI